MQPRTVENTQASPASGSSRSAYYRLDTTRLTFAELWRHSSPSYLGFVIAAVAKIVRRSLPARIGFAPELNRLIDVGDVPQHAMRKLEGLIARCEQQGFVRRFALLPNVVGDAEGWNVVLSNRDRTVLAGIVYAKSRGLTEIVATFISKLSDGGIVTTTNGKHRLNVPPGFLTAHHVGATVEELVKIHTARVNELPRVRPLVVDDVAQRQLFLDTAQRSLDYFRQRGVWVPLCEEELERLRSTTAPAG